jgi:energy-coupling factor transport system ATP-binding protein
MASQLGPGPSRVQLNRYGFRYLANSRWTVRNIDLDVAAGERVLLLGPSGSGKSTLLQAIGGLLGTDAGDIEGGIAIDGAPVRPATGGHDQSGTGFVFQDPDSQLVMSRCGDEVAFGLENAGVPRDEIWPRVRQALDAVGFHYGLDRPTTALSGGERQRLVLAGALVLRPGLLLLDEPTANLDEDGTRLVLDALASTTADRSTTMIMVEHKIGPVLPLVDRVVVIGSAGLIADGRPADVLAAEHDRLAADGVWVDDRVPWQPEPHRRRPAATELLAVEAPRRRHGPGDLVPAPVSFGVDSGTVTAVRGPNGVGKSTLGSMLAGLAAPDAGRIVASPELCRGLTARQAAKPIHRWRSEQLAPRITTVFQNPEHQFLTGRVTDEISLGPPKARSAYVRRAGELLERLGLSGLADANPFTLSGGEKRRLSVATALAGRPRMVILDEPTFGQDRNTWIEVCRLLCELADNGTALVLLTHDDRLTSALADEVVSLSKPAQPSTAAGADLVQGTVA